MVAALLLNPQTVQLRDVLPIIIAVVGWIVVHVLTLRAQRRSFQNQILDRARLEITARVRAYQDWLSELAAWLGSLSWLPKALELGMQVNVHAKTSEYNTLITRKDDRRSWNSFSKIIESFSRKLISLGEG